jgi:hypothetical protein
MQTVLLQSVKMCGIATRVLEEKQVPEIAEYIAIDVCLDLTTPRQTLTKGYWVRHSGNMKAPNYD